MVDSYREALEYLYSLTNYETKSQFAYAPQFFDLKRVQRLLNALGNPHRKFRSVHVAGTKGKGSTCAMLESILRSAGHRTGLYTSPHLHSFRERIQTSGAPIAESDFVALVRAIRPLAEKDEELTTFEVATVLAFLHFARAGVEIAVVEVGLGGRLDATNVISPLVSIITTIGHDHMHILGNTLAEIAGEKAGIIKKGVAVVTAPQSPVALAVIQRQCADKGAALYRVSDQWQWRATQCTLEGQRFTVASRRRSSSAAHTSFIGLYMPLLGTHQLRNAAVVLTAVQTLRESGVEVSDTAIRQGLRDVVWPARFEIMGRQPFFVVDGAHNVDSARALAKTMQQHFPGIQPWLVLAILSDKDIAAVLNQLLPLAKGALLSRSRHPRAAEPRQLLEAAAASPTPTEVLPDLAAATERAIELAGSHGLVVAAGSFSTAGEVRESWLRLHRRPLPPMDPV